jgi:peptide chain release factor 1
LAEVYGDVMDVKSQIAQLRLRFGELERKLADPKVFASPKRASELGREHARLKSLLANHERLTKVESDIAASREMARDAKGDAELRAMAEEELGLLEQERARLEREIQLALAPPDPNEGKPVIVEIRAGTGGEEAALFAADLYRMYARYAESQGWKVETMEASGSERGGFKEIVFSVQGENVFRKLRYESGVHRVQRVPLTEASGRIHTSTASVAVLPEAEEVDVVIKPEDLEVSVCRASGPGGQGVNTTDSAVQIVHKPSGLIVTCSDERSQLKNKAKALRVLRTRLLAIKVEEEQAKLTAERRSQIGSADRSEKIRTYNFPQNRVTDHRIGLTIQNLPAILEGELDALIGALAARDLEERLRSVRSGV